MERSEGSIGCVAAIVVVCGEGYGCEHRWICQLWYSTCKSGGTPRQKRPFLIPCLSIFLESIPRKKYILNIVVDKVNKHSENPRHDTRHISVNIRPTN